MTYPFPMIISNNHCHAHHRIGFGIGEEGAGAMAGSDILLCDTYGAGGEWICKDTYATSESQPRTSTS